MSPERPSMATIKEIEEFSRQIATEYHPERILLFGSYARGTTTPDSDVDLLVILRFEGNPAHKSTEMRLKFRPRFPLDLIVRTPDKVQERIELGDGFMNEILREGKVLYEAHHG